MTFRELLNRYKAGELGPEQAKEVEEVIDREDALLEYLSERDVLPELDEIAGSAPDGAESEMKKKFQRELKRGIRRAFIRLGVCVGAVLLAILLLALFVLPQAVDLLYYDPGETAGSYETESFSYSTNRMSLDMAVYSELFLPGVYRENVSVVDHGYGEYDVLVIQNVSYAGRPMVDVGGHISRGRLLLYDANLFKAPVGNCFEWCINFRDPDKSLSEQIKPPVELGDGTTELYAMGIAGYPEDARERLTELQDGQIYQGFVTLDRVMDYDSFYALLKELGQTHIWCAVQLSDNPSELVNWGFYVDYGQGGRVLAWLKDRYPALKRDGEELSIVENGEMAKMHMQSLIRYLGDNPDFPNMMSRDYGYSGYTAVAELPQFVSTKRQDLSPLIDYIDQHGVQIYGFWLMADKETLLRLQDSPEVYSVAVEPLR